MYPRDLINKNPDLTDRQKLALHVCYDELDYDLEQAIKEQANKYLEDDEKL